jgi:hypothetical protein
MPQKIKPKRSYTANAVPVVSGGTPDIERNEIAINWTDSKLYTRNNSDQLVSITLGGGGGSGSGSVVTAATVSAFPATGSSSGVIYVATDTARAYIWAGAYIEVGANGGGSGIAWSSAPASATATGTAGQIAYDGDYLYVATAANTWERAALSTWTPVASIAGLQAWYDASDASTLYDATSGGSLVAADGAVARWQDKSGNGRHATQDSQTLQPLRKAAVRAGRDVLRFDGSNDSLRASNVFNATASYTVFFVGRGDTIDDNGRAFVSLAPETTLTQGYFHYLYRNDITNKSRVMFTTDGVDQNLSTDTAASTTYNAFHYMSAVHSATQREWWVNGVSQGTANTASGSAVFSSAELRVGWYYARSAGAGFYSLEGDIGEIIIYNTALSSTDRGRVESYLAAKWAIT